MQKLMNCPSNMPLTSMGFTLDDIAATKGAVQTQLVKEFAAARDL